MQSFAKALRTSRERAGLSQRALARIARINPAIISRMEAADRGPSGPEQVLAIATALDLNEEGSDLLLASAGYWPRAILRLGPLDETLLAVARVLTSQEVSEASRRRFREAVRLMSEQWMETPD